MYTTCVAWGSNVDVTCAKEAMVKRGKSRWPLDRGSYARTGEERHDLRRMPYKEAGTLYLQGWRLTKNGLTDAEGRRVCEAG